MKNVNNIAAFSAAVKSKVERADALGTKTTWDTADHNAALAKAIASATDPEHDAAYVAIILDVLQDGYNISGFQQMLSKVPAYAAKGHFQRSDRKVPTTNEFLKALGIPQ